MERAPLTIPMPLILCIGIALLLSTLPAQAATTEVHLVKYASDETTVLNERTVTYGWMEENLPVQGDGVTHYFHQGPMFGEKFENDPWDINETTNIDSRDFGAVKGTDIKDLCELVGGMSSGEEIMIHASDGFRKYFGYANVYDPDPRQGQMVLTWWRADDGYVPDYSTGMRLVFFAGDHVFGHWDMHECLSPEYWYNYTDSDGGHPSSGGLSIKNIDRIVIYSMMDPPELCSIDISPANLTLDIGYEQQFNAIAYDQYGTEISNIIFVWASDNETVGTINATGLFTALSAGNVTITAENETVKGTVNATVKSQVPASTPTPTPSPDPTHLPDPILTIINILPSSVTLNISGTQQFNAIAYDQHYNEMFGVTFNWTTSNTTIGTINNTGFFRANTIGTTMIKATNGNVDGTGSVMVSSTEPAEIPKAKVAPSSSPTSVTTTPNATKIPLPSTTPAPVQTSTPVPSSSVQGFEALSAIGGLLAIAYVIKWRKKIK
ncbi:MAG: hypothetical protein AEth_01268 [Candidatus Argoarchaeum ethanivorans]|uniref:BIG2 domain-containing protein n=1 Tax=Candidatus Argoarchaeum ethanivorans TaxID=2608793 RepID=A0A8B3S1W5_9EURY|nr:MAG: hypothetical protein AEth_01268 [Candidatus Argoarchaeum ethanivorans]